MKINQILSEGKNFLKDWGNAEPAEFARSLTKKFGKPNESTPDRVIWHDRDGFKRIEVQDEYIMHCCPEPQVGCTRAGTLRNRQTALVCQGKSHRRRWRS